MTTGTLRGPFSRFGSHTNFYTGHVRYLLKRVPRGRVTRFLDRTSRSVRSTYDTKLGVRQLRADQARWIIHLDTNAHWISGYASTLMSFPFMRGSMEEEKTDSVHSDLESTSPHNKIIARTLQPTKASCQLRKKTPFIKEW